MYKTLIRKDESRSQVSSIWVPNLYVFLKPVSGWDYVIFPKSYDLEKNTCSQLKSFS